MAKTYEDIGKDANEFVTKGFPNSGLFKVSVETKTPDGVTVRGAASRNYTYKDKDNIDEKVFAEVEPKYKVGEVEYNAKISTVGEYEYGVALENLGLKGTKGTLTAFQSDADGNAVKGSIAFKNDNVSSKATLKYPLSKPFANWNGELTYRHDKFCGGVGATFDQFIGKEEKQPNRLAYNVKAGYLSKEQQVVAALEQQQNRDKKTAAATPLLNILSVNYLYSLTSAVKLGLGLSYETNKVKAPEVHTAAEYKVDKDTVVKGRLSYVHAADNQDVRLAIGVKQNVSEHINVTVGADLNARAIAGQTLGTTKPHSFGFELKFQ